jgi:hypothetical protein
MIDFIPAVGKVIGDIVEIVTQDSEGFFVIGEKIPIERQDGLYVFRGDRFKPDVFHPKLIKFLNEQDISKIEDVKEPPKTLYRALGYPDPEVSIPQDANAARLRMEVAELRKEIERLQLVKSRLLLDLLSIEKESN